jgi:hypothetical protein
MPKMKPYNMPKLDGDMAYQQDASDLPFHQVIKSLIVSLQVMDLVESIPDDAIHVATRQQWSL